MHCMYVARAIVYIYSTRDVKVNDSKWTRSDYDIVASNCVKTSAQQLLNVHAYALLYCTQ